MLLRRSFMSKKKHDNPFSPDQEPQEPVETNEADENATDEKYEALHQQYIRLAADFDNYRKRVDAERSELLSYGTESALGEMIKVLDNFERGGKSLEGVNECDKVKESFDLIYRQTREALQKLGLEPIETEGKEFDPNFHEAVMQTPTSDYPEHTIINELQKGYKYKDKVLRPALVNVATG
jgi:molecular chaperone GrpE